MRIVVEGCGHGELDQIYDSIQKMERHTGKVDLLICCGDFQAVRNQADLDCLACPPKYRRMMDFHKYPTQNLVFFSVRLFILSLLC